MSVRILAPMLALASIMAFAQDTIELAPGLIISKPVKFSAQDRLVLPPGPASTCLTIKGNDITVDFGGSYVRGGKDVYHNRENFDGVGLLIDGCKNVTVKNANIQGFRFNVKIVNSDNVKIESSDVSFSRTFRMMQNNAPLDAFMNLRDNSQWRTYGAGIWVENSTNCTLEKCNGTGALIGAVLIDSSGCLVHNCDFSFNGGWGVAMSHSKENVVAWNHLDFVNRAWQGGWGGDSAALAVADACQHNYFVGNSMTHGGDGYFLSNRNDIGPIDPQSGFFNPQGGSDHNVIAYNDGSWSPNNAFEGTFSDSNIYIGNTASFSGFGFWLGFSTNSLVIENTINDNGHGGIAIEQGKGNRIDGNHMDRNAVSAIHLWASVQKERSPFPSTNIDILGNSISESPLAYDLTGSTDVAIKGNKLLRAAAGDFVPASRTVTDPLGDFQQTLDWTKLQEIVGTKPPDFKMYAEQLGPKGIQWLQPSDYTPKDFRGDLVAQRQADPGVIEVYLLEKGLKLYAPDWVDFVDTDDPYLTRILAKTDDVDVGEDKPVEVSIVSKDGTRKQVVTGTLRTVAWTLKWFSWSGLRYDDSDGWARLWAGTPLKVERSRNIGGDWTGRSPADGVPSDHFALLATTTIKVAAGRYLFHTVSDDGIRLFVDDRTVIERWNHHGATPDNVPVDLDASPHTFRVEYCQEDGAAVLQLDWSKV